MLMEIGQTRKNEAVWVFPQTDFVNFRSEPAPTSILDDPERLDQTWEDALQFGRDIAGSTPEEDERVKAAFLEFHEKHNRLHTEQQEPTHPESYQEPGRLERIARRIGSRLPLHDRNVE